MYILSVIASKGGAAKTTTAQALAASIRLHGGLLGGNVLAIDLDPQGNLTAASTSPTPNKTIYGVLTGEYTAAAAITPCQGYDLIASAPALAGRTFTNTCKPDTLKRALATVANAYAYCIIDSPPQVGLLTAAAALAADGIVIPLQADVFALQALRQTTELIDSINPGANKLGVLLTRYTARANITHAIEQAIADIAPQCGTALLTTPIRETVAIREAQAARETIYSYAPKSKAAADYKAATAELLYIINEKRKEQRQ